MKSDIYFFSFLLLEFINNETIELINQSNSHMVRIKKKSFKRNQ